MSNAEPDAVLPKDPPPRQRRRRWPWVVLALLLLLLLGGGFWVYRLLHAPPIEPIELTLAEEQVLDAKLEALSAGGTSQAPADKTLSISERELNALLSKNTGLGGKVYLALGQDRVEARWNIPVEEELPVLGGKTLRGTLLMGLTLEGSNLVATVEEVKVSGLSLPNAWLGDIKHVNLVENYLAGDPTLDAFIRGIESLEVNPGELRIVLAE